MDIKKMLIVSFVVAVLLLVPFNVIAAPISLDSRIVSEDDSKLVEEPELPDNTDLERIDISIYDLADFNQRVKEVNKLIAAVEDYIGEDLPMKNVPVFVNGVKVGSVSIIDTDELETISGLSGIFECLYALAALIIWILFAPILPPGWWTIAFDALIGCLTIGGPLTTAQPQAVSDCGCNQMDVALR